ncbi:MAG: glutamine synthetase [Bdellovibrionaceae bacterium]|nr:glutamine synthetase [Pseudobdellovibrionaceae bacterium]
MGFSKQDSDVKVLATAEYLWLDGATPTQELRAKTRILNKVSANSLEDFPEWGFDGSSTWQAHGSHSDCILKPVYFCLNPLRAITGNHYLVVCEVYESDGEPHASNSRKALRELLDKSKAANPWIGFEQEYTLFEYNRPLGWPDKGGFPAPQGPFYCGVGVSKVFGRNIVEEHMDMCQRAGLSFYGINAEVMPSQWEFQVGYRGVNTEKNDPLTISDQMWVARYMLLRVAEKHNAIISFSNKPMPGDWNGAGMHTNFSTDATRAKGGIEAINKAVENLKEKHSQHIRNYGAGLEDRLTGLHETCHIGQFKSGVSDRGASIRIPLQTSQKGCGYFEDRRPGANADPYKVSACLVEATCL